MTEDTEATEMPIEELLAMMRVDSKADPTLVAVLENYHARIKANTAAITSLDGRTTGQMRVGGRAGG